MAITFYFRPKKPLYIHNRREMQKQFVDFICARFREWRPCAECPWAGKFNIEYDTLGFGSVTINLPFLTFLESGAANQEIIDMLNKAEENIYCLTSSVYVIEDDIEFLNHNGSEKRGYVYPMSYLKTLEEKSSPQKDKDSKEAEVNKFRFVGSSQVESRESKLISKKTVDNFLKNMIEKRIHGKKPIEWVLVNVDGQPCVRMSLPVQEDSKAWFEEALKDLKISFIRMAGEEHFRLVIHNVDQSTFAAPSLVVSLPTS